MFELLPRSFEDGYRNDVLAEPLQ
ncbi:hypothetical protein SMG44B_10827 [Stenotrophomonas maltophilia]